MISYKDNHMLYSLIVAYDLDRGIGKNGNLPWKLPKDLQRFKDLTTESLSNCVIMGRKTWESLPPKFRPLPDRINIVMSKSKPPTDLTQQDNAPVYFCQSFDENTQEHC